MTKPLTLTTATLPGQVCNFLQTNPDEELTALDVYEKFGGSRTSVHSKLIDSLHAGLLKRIKNAESEYVYIAGPKLASATIFKAELPDPAGDPDATAPPSKHTKGAALLTQGFAPIGKAPSLDDITIQDGAPTRPGGRGANATYKKMDALFDKLQPSQYITLHPSFKYVAATCMTRWHKDTTRRYAKRMHPDGVQINIYRVA